MSEVYIVEEWSVNWDGWQVGMRKRILVTSNREKAIAALGTKEQGWDVYTGTHEWDNEFYGFAHADSTLGKRRAITVLEVED